MKDILPEKISSRSQEACVGQTRSLFYSRRRDAKKEKLVDRIR